jgi:hypothetical protein
MVIVAAVTIHCQPGADFVGCTGLGIAGDTSPSAYLGLECDGIVAFQAAVSSHLWYYNTYDGINYDTNLGMQPGTSPSIFVDTATTGPYYDEIAFQANTGHLLVYDQENNTHVDSSLGMAPNTSPSVDA